MTVQSLLEEFKYETQSTRKLLQAIPDSALDFKPSDVSWTTAQLASHIATIYKWYSGTFGTSELNFDNFSYDAGDISTMKSILERFEENAKEAESLLANATDEDMQENWRMLANGKEVIPSTPRLQVVRSFLFNHIYHHRGEMIVYLRSTGNKVPGLYGPTAEQSAQQ